MIKVSVIVRCLNEEAHIGRLLTGIERQSVRPHEVVVVDSGSTDATLAIARQFSSVRVVHIDPCEFSFGRSLNLGIAASEGDALVVASAHVYPQRDTWLERLVEPLRDPEVAGTYGRQEGDHRTRYSEHQIFRCWFPVKDAGPQDDPFSNNANAAVRRSVWELLPFDEELTGLEDIDWAKRATEKGYRIAYVPTATVAHVHEESWTQVRNRYRREAIAHAAIFPGQEVRGRHAVGLALMNIGSDAVRAVQDRCLAKVLPSIVAFRTCQFLGTFEGFQQRGPVTSGLRRRLYYPQRVDRDDPIEDGKALQYADAPVVSVSSGGAD